MSSLSLANVDFPEEVSQLEEKRQPTYPSGLFSKEWTCVDWGGRGKLVWEGSGFALYVVHQGNDKFFCALLSSHCKEEASKFGWYVNAYVQTKTCRKWQLKKVTADLFELGQKLACMRNAGWTIVAHTKNGQVVLTNPLTDETYYLRNKKGTRKQAFFERRISSKRLHKRAAKIPASPLTHLHNLQIHDEMLQLLKDGFTDQSNSFVSQHLIARYPSLDIHQLSQALEAAEDGSPSAVEKSLVKLLSP